MSWTYALDRRNSLLNTTPQLERSSRLERSQDFQIRTLHMTGHENLGDFIFMPQAL
jgi:hypothetical protein